MWYLIGYKNHRKPDTRLPWTSEADIRGNSLRCTAPVAALDHVEVFRIKSCVASDRWVHKRLLWAQGSCHTIWDAQHSTQCTGSVHVAGLGDDSPWPSTADTKCSCSLGILGNNEEAGARPNQRLKQEQGLKLCVKLRCTLRHTQKGQTWPLAGPMAGTDFGCTCACLA